MIWDVTTFGYISNNGIITITGNNVKEENNMPSSKANLILHPIRLQIITAISTQEMTAKELAKVIGDVPQTTLYRHINALVEGGILKVTGEAQIRGTLERTYAMAGVPSLRAEDLRGMKKQDYEQAFIIYLSTLMNAARRYLDNKPDNEEINPIEDGVDLSLAQLLLSDEEFKAMNQQILDLLLAKANNQPSPNRKLRLFTYLFIPQ
jgi:DNA-binding transcriptional ArsR family regulator